MSRSRRLLPFVFVAVALCLSVAVGGVTPVVASTEAHPGPTASATDEIPVSLGLSHAPSNRLDPVTDPFAHTFAADRSDVLALDPTADRRFGSTGRFDDSDAPDDGDSLDNDARAQVYDTVVRSPGAYPTRIADETGLHRSTVRYHLRVLEDAGLLVAEKSNGKRRYFPRETDATAVASVLTDESLAPVVRTLARREPLSVSALADHLDRAPSTVSYHLSRLADRDLVRKERQGQSVAVSLSDRARDALTHAAAEPDPPLSAERA